MEEKLNLYKTMNIPPRDIKKYPMLNTDDQMKAGLFCYQLALIGNCLDGNLQALVWDMYLKISNYLKDEGSDNPQDRLSMMAESLDNLKEYVKESRNPVFNKLPPKDKLTSQSLFKEASKGGLSEKGGPKEGLERA